jgi:hypothetical protein
MDFGSPWRTLSGRSFLFAALALLLCKAVAASGPAPTPASIELEIDRNGASATLNRLYRSDPEWSALMGGIASGTVEWLQIAKALHGDSDGGAAEQLVIAAGEALEHHPANVLTVLGGDIDVADICSGPDVDDERFNSFSQSLAAILRRQKMLRTIRDPRLIQLRDQCVSELDQAKLHIATFYHSAGASPGTAAAASVASRESPGSSIPRAFDYSRFQDGKIVEKRHVREGDPAYDAVVELLKTDPTGWNVDFNTYAPALLFQSKTLNVNCTDDMIVINTGRAGSSTWRQYTMHTSSCKTIDFLRRIPVPITNGR